MLITHELTASSHALALLKTGDVTQCHFYATALSDCAPACFAVAADICVTFLVTYITLLYHVD